MYLKYLRAVVPALIATALLFSFAGFVQASEVTLRMRGGSFEIKGDLKSYDLKSWVIDAPGLGMLSLDASRYECASGNCPTGPLVPRPIPNLPFEPVTTTWVGGSAIGTEFMPRLIRAYAASLGAQVEMQVGSDPKNLEFVLTAADGRKLGQVNVNRQGVPQGFAAMTKAEADVVWTGREILPEEEQMMAGSGIANMRHPANQHVWGLDALVVLVAKENPVTSLSLDNVARIFSGAIKDWSQLGFPPGRINVYAPTAEMGTWGYFESAVLATRGLKISPNAVRLQHATEWSDRVAADRFGIGINTIALVRKAKPVNIEATCGIVTTPSIFGAKTEEYPLTGRLYFYTAGQPKNPLAAALLAFALSPQIQPVLKEARFVDQDSELTPFLAHTGRIAIALNASDEDYDANLMTKLIEDIRPAQRLSLTFRFSSGVAALDSRGTEDIRRLRDWLQRPEAAGKSIMLVGFSDAMGRFPTNLLLAQKRAQFVRGELIKGTPALARGVSILERAYGELAPVACNDTETGRSLNRRVEVWVR